MTFAILAAIFFAIRWFFASWRAKRVSGVLDELLSLSDDPAALAEAAQNYSVRRNINDARITLSRPQWLAKINRDAWMDADFDVRG